MTNRYTAPYYRNNLWAAIQATRLKQAEDVYLAPLGLNTDLFLSQQKEYSESFVERVTNQLQNYAGPDVEALVVGGDGSHAHIYHVDYRGTVSNMGDLGFAAIGIGAWHARSRLMQSGYVNNSNFARAVTATFAAKRSGEIAPGVGAYTDAYVVFKESIEPLRPEVYEKSKTIYEEKASKRRVLDEEAVTELEQYLTNLGAPPTESVPNSEATS